MIISFIIGVVLRLLNVVFSFFPAISGLTNGFSDAIIFFMNSAMAWNFLLPITDALILLVRVIQFEFALALLYAGKYVIELVRGK